MARSRSIGGTAGHYSSRGIRAGPKARAAAAEPVDRRAIERAHEAQALEGVSFFNRATRKAGKELAAQAAAHQIQEEEASRAAERAEHQSSMDESWFKLVDNDPDLVLTVLEEAFEDNRAPAAAIDCEGSELTVAMIFGQPDDVVPEKRPNVTDTGRTTIKKRTKTERNDFYFACAATNVAVTLKEAFAVAPGIDAAKALVVRREDKEGQPTELAAILYLTVTREQFEQGQLAGTEWLRSRSSLTLREW